VVAAALTDLDDRLTGRLRNLAITLVCFFIASASVELLFPGRGCLRGLTVSTIGFILLGGLGQRYATIAFGALLIAIYTMLGVTLYEPLVSAAAVFAGWRGVVQPADPLRTSDFPYPSSSGQSGTQLRAVSSLSGA
jgi:uncharacterized membrane protein YccC